MMNSEMLEKSLSKQYFAKDAVFVKSLRNVELLSQKSFLQNVIKPIYDESTQCFEITQGDLKNAHESKVEKCPVIESGCTVVAVKKLKPLKTPKLKKEKVVVAIPAPPDAPLKEPKIAQDSKNTADSVKFRSDGRIISYSVLGSVKDFLKEAEKSGIDKEKLSLWKGERNVEEDGTRERHGQRKSGRTRKNKMLAEKSRSLENWRRRMQERMCQQNYLSCLLMRPVEHLAMNQGELIRQANENRTIIDLVAPFVEHGKGDRTGSEFWQGPIQLNRSEDCDGLHSSLTHGQKGYPATMSYVDIPDFIQCCEKGLDRSKLLTSIHRPWLRSLYLKNRLDQLKGLFYELNPHVPQTGNLMIQGYNYESLMSHLQQHQWQEEQRRKQEAGGKGEDEEAVSHVSRWDFSSAIKNFSDNGHGTLSSLSPDITQGSVVSNVRVKSCKVVENFVCSPALLFGDFKVAWHDPSSTNVPCWSDLEVRVVFEAHISCRQDSKFQIVNNGCTSIYYGWRKIDESPSFEEIRQTASKFYFNPSQGVILSGETRTFDCGFRSHEHGIYEERWQFFTNPVIHGAGRMVMVFRGVVLKPDTNRAQRDQLIGELKRRASFQVAGDLVNEIVCSVKETERPPSPPLPILEEDRFNEINNGMFIYGRQKCQGLRNIHKETITFLKSLPREETSHTITNVPSEGVIEECLSEEWNLNLDSLKRLIVSMPEEEELKQDLLHRFNSIVVSMSFHKFQPLIRDHHYHNVHMDLCDALERIDGIFDRELDLLKVLAGKAGGEDVDVQKDKVKGKKATTTQKSPEETFYAKIKSRERLYAMVYNVLCEFIENIDLNMSGVKHQCNVSTGFPIVN